jgi:hypothetical protein
MQFRVVTMQTATPEPMDRFPCARLDSRFYSIGSDLSLVPHEFDSAFSSALETGEAIDASDATKVQICSVRPSTLHAWLMDIVRPFGASPLLGPVPMSIHSLRVSPSCISLGNGRPRVVRIEFVVHRYGDARGVHYTCLVSHALPYRLFAYKRVGTVSAGMLWSVSSGVDLGE